MSTGNKTAAVAQHVQAFTSHAEACVFESQTDLSL